MSGEIKKEYIKISNVFSSFLILRSKFHIDDVFPEFSEESYTLSQEFLTDEEYAKLPEFTGF